MDFVEFIHHIRQQVAFVLAGDADRDLALALIFDDFRSGFILLENHAAAPDVPLRLNQWVGRQMNRVRMPLGMNS
jgi:hypothetical protein